jgi:hypothetical protein
VRIAFSLLGYELIALDIGEPPVCGCGGEANLTASHLEHAAPAGIGFRVDPIPSVEGPDPWINGGASCRSTTPSPRTRPASR